MTQERSDPVSGDAIAQHRVAVWMSRIREG